MTMLVLFNNVVGMALREWRGCRRLTHQAVAVALVILVGTVLMLTRGNYLGGQSAKPVSIKPPAESQSAPAGVRR